MKIYCFTESGSDSQESGSNSPNDFLLRLFVDLSQIGFFVGKIQPINIQELIEILV